jgi:hypothetical protein
LLDCELLSDENDQMSLNGWCALTIQFAARNPMIDRALFAERFITIFRSRLYSNFIAREIDEEEKNSTSRHERLLLLAFHRGNLLSFLIPVRNEAKCSNLLWRGFLFISRALALKMSRLCQLGCVELSRAF